MELNKIQQVAVKHKEGPMLILAGAGSGKTTVLSYRTNNLLEDGVLPSEILCITFTNKAAQELKHRISLYAGEENGSKIWVSTFHFLSLDMLRTYQREGVSVVRSQYTRQILKKIIEAMKISDPRQKEIFKAGKVLRLISLFKNELIYPKHFTAKTALSPFVRPNKVEEIFVSDKDFQKELDFDLFVKIFTLYQKKLQVDNVIDVDDIIPHSIFLLLKNEHILETYRERFKYIMIDEYQDVNHGQYILSKLLAEKHKNICVVGDDFQSIYAFRGSDIQNILNFEKDYPQAKTFKLEENYRSTKTILQAANQIISYNPEQKEKELFTFNPEGEKILYHQAKTVLDEAKYVVKKIRELVSNGYEYRDIAIFYRNNADSVSFETIFKEEGIPYQITKESSFFDQKVVKDIQAYLTFINNTSDVQSFRTIINTPKRGIGKATIDKIVEKAGGKDLLSVCKDPSDIDRISSKVKVALGEFVSVIEKCSKKLPLLSFSQSVSFIAKETGYLSSLDELEEKLKKDALEYLDKFISISRELENDKPGLSLIDYLNLLSKTDVDATMVEEEFNKVNLLTIHSSKGLEFPAVFLTGMYKGSFPSKYAFSDFAIQEERRLCYVAFTRARQFLSLSLPSVVLVEGEDGEKKEENTIPSLFLSEFDTSLRKEV